MGAEASLQTSGMGRVQGRSTYVPSDVRAVEALLDTYVIVILMDMLFELAKQHVGVALGADSRENKHQREIHGCNSCLRLCIRDSDKTHRLQLQRNTISVDYRIIFLSHTT